VSTTCPGSASLSQRPHGDTIAGLLPILLGQIPTAPGETVTIDGWAAEVVEVAHHAISRSGSARRRTLDNTTAAPPANDADLRPARIPGVMPVGDEGELVAGRRGATL